MTHHEKGIDREKLIRALRDDVDKTIEDLKGLREKLDGTEA